MNQIDIDDKYVNSTAYHEAGHIVVAAVQQMPMRNLGVRMDSLGCGKAFYWRRVPDGSRNNVGPDAERERTIISTSAGYIAQKRFYGDSLTEDIKKYMEFSANPDTSLVIELLEEMYSGDRVLWFQARKLLYDQSVQLVDDHWKAIDTLEGSLLSRAWEPRQTNTDADGRWSVDDREKRLHGIEILHILEPLGINAFTLDDSVQSYSLTLHPQGSTSGKTGDGDGMCPTPVQPPFSTAFHRKNSPRCDEQPLLRISERASWIHARGLSQQSSGRRSQAGIAVRAVQR